MIEAFVGLVGGGKSCNSVRRMCAYMAVGGRVVSNIRLIGWCDRIMDLCPLSPVYDYMRGLGWHYQRGQYLYISFDTMVSDPSWYQRIPAGQSRDLRTLVVVDEATDLFDNLDRDKVRADSGYRALFRFLRLSRHAHIDVMFIAQDLSAINSRLRALVGAIWRSTDMRNFPIAGLRIKLPFNVFLLQKFDRTGKYPLAKSEWIRKDKRVFGLYESEAFGADLGVKWDGVAIDPAKARVKKGDDDMSVGMRALVIANCVGLVAVALYLILSDAGESQAVGAPAVVDRPMLPDNSNRLRSAPVTNSVKTAPRVVFGDYSYHSNLKNRWVKFDGMVLQMGYPSPYGVVTDLSDRFVRCVTDGGSDVWLMSGAAAPARSSDAL